MGQMTVISILNDGFDQILKYPEKFVDNISLSIEGKDEFNYYNQKSINSYGVGNHCNLMNVSKSFHSNYYKLFLAGQNYMSDLTDVTAKSKKELEQQLDKIQKAKELLTNSENELIKQLEKLK